MDEIVTERSASVLRVQLSRPTKRNAMTSSICATLADVFNGAAKDERTRVVLWHGAGDSFCAGNDVEDFSEESSTARRSPQAQLMNALVDFDKPLIAADRSLSSRHSSRRRSRRRAETEAARYRREVSGQSDPASLVRHRLALQAATVTRKDRP